LQNKVADGSVDSIIYCRIRLQMEAWTLLYIAEDNKVADGSMESIIYCRRQQGWRQKSDEGSKLYTLLHEARIRRELIL
jgi:hypothetical protein